MEFLQHIDGGMALLVAVGLCALCLVLPILLSGLHFVGLFIDLLGNVVGAIVGIISGGPASWCGCLAVIGGCGLVIAVVWLISTGLSTCATYPTNFCALFGR
jgi:hypothetical protein